METIVQQILWNTFEKIMEYYGRVGLQQIFVMADEFKAIGDEMMREMLRVFIENADRALCEEAKAERKADGYTIKERDVQRTTHTFLGEVTFGRTHFKTKGGGYAHILDNILGIAAYERVDAGVSAKMVNASADFSFGKSAAIVTGGEVGRQTAWNRMHGVGEVVYVPTRSVHTPEILHIFADEDHVNLQDGTNVIVPLVTYCAGKEYVCKGRNALIDPVHIQGFGLTPEEHWSYVYAVMAEQYDMTKVKQVFIYGDGASWIKAGFDVFPNVVYVLDEYHLEKRIKSILSGDICRTFAPRVRAAVNSGDSMAFRKLLNEMTDAVANGMEEGGGLRKKLKAVRENGAFLLAHWQAMLAGRLPDAIGSCTEAQVSHVLSKRFSRDPMGWSKMGLAKTAMVRAFRQNGGTVMPCDIGAGKTLGRARVLPRNIKRYEDIVKKQHNEVFKDWRDWRWFEKDDNDRISHKRTGTRTALDALGKMRDIS